LDSEATLAKSQQKNIAEQFEVAEETFDEILQAIADELDKLPVEDPIASLLRDPTLDEILAQLENEQDFLEELGLSNRPSNLQIIGGWSNRRGGGGGGGGMLRQLMNQQQRMRNLSNLAYRNALDRARDKNKSAKKKPKLAKEDRRWNLLVSELGEEMLQGDNKIPPERYRTAIDNYFEQISRLKNAQEPD
jgi:mevalonate kinase